MSNLVKYAEDELALIGMGPDVEDEMNRAMREHILTMVHAFADEGHSGFSASYALGVLQKVLAYEPVTPLTGEDGEWQVLGYADDMAAQNRRCAHVFKRADGTAYDSNGRIFREPSGSCFTGRGSRVDITFPYTPTREYVDVDEDGVPLDPTISREDER
jgi:hypothetical protein